MATAQKTRISAILPSILTREMRRVSHLEQVPQSKIIEMALRSWLEKKLDKDTKELSNIDFTDLPSEQEWLNLQSHA